MADGAAEVDAAAEVDVEADADVRVYDLAGAVVVAVAAAPLADAAKGIKTGQAIGQVSVLPSLPPNSHPATAACSNSSSSSDLTIS